MSLLRVENCNGQGLVMVLDWPGEPPEEQVTRRELVNTDRALASSDAEIAATYRFPEPDMPNALRVA